MSYIINNSVNLITREECYALTHLKLAARVLKAFVHLSLCSDVRGGSEDIAER